MRLAWWRPAPGMVRVRQRQLIQLQSAALRAGEIEAETASLRRESAAIAAEGRAAACLDSWGLEAPRDLLDDLPSIGKHRGVGGVLDAFFLAEGQLRIDGETDNGKDRQQGKGPDDSDIALAMAEILAGSAGSH